MRIFSKILAAVLSLTSIGVFAQIDFESQLPKNIVYTEKIVDSIYGITVFEGLNHSTGGDSTRLCKGYVCEGWVEDKYDSGQLLHKGYYLDGHLSAYKNYYPNGQLERNFKSIDLFTSSVKMYYSSGQMKTEAKFIQGVAQTWTDYYENGNKSYYEKYHKSFTYHLQKLAFYDDGSKKSEFILDNKKKLLFIDKAYYQNGKVKVDGITKYDDDFFDYYKEGSWKFYDESGTLTKEQTYSRGQMLKEKTF